jgi:uncharacterized protein (DUF697 family)/CRP-like cAMP-binding protein
MFGGKTMTSIIADQSTILSRILDRAADNLSFEKLLFQLGLDPNNITYSALFDRLSDVFLANINVANICALIGAAFFVATLLTRTMVPLRVFGIISAVFFMAFGALAHDIKTFLLYLLLLPINGIRLYQMITLVKTARSAMQGDTSMEWLKPFMTQRKYRRGDVLFNKGDAANEMFLTVTGKFLVTEIGVELPPGRLMGEIGFLTPDNRRTATVKCTEAGRVLTITYEKLLELYFQNPQFGYYFLVLTSQRLLQNNARLEGIIASTPDKAALMHPIEAQDGDAKTSTAKQETPSTVTWVEESLGPRHATSPGSTEQSPDDRRASAVKVVKRFSLWSGAAGIIPVPFVDLAAVGGIQIQMLHRISQIYGVPFSRNRGKTLVFSLAGSMIPISSGIGAASLIKSVPIVGTAMSATVMPAMSAGATYAIGMTFIQHFASGGTLLDFNPTDYREYLKAQRELWRTRFEARATPKAAASQRDPSTRSNPLRAGLTSSWLPVERALRRWSPPRRG